MTSAISQRSIVTRWEPHQHLLVQPAGMGSAANAPTAGVLMGWQAVPLLGKEVLKRLLQKLVLIKPMLKGILWRAASPSEGAAWAPAAASTIEVSKVVSCMLMIW